MDIKGQPFETILYINFYTTEMLAAKKRITNKNTLTLLSHLKTQSKHLTYNINFDRR